LLCDTRREVGLAYGACDTPDAEYARRISYLIGADGIIQKVWPKVAPSTHPQEVLASL
jgi:peroxiredoxin